MVKEGSDPNSPDINNQRQSLFESIFNGSLDAIVSISLDGSITSWNPAAEHFFGWRKGEVIGRNISILMPEAKVDELSMTLGKLSLNEPFQFETIRINKEKELLPVFLTISPLKNALGIITGGMAIIRDLTPLNNAEILFRDIFESSPDAMVISDNTGTIVKVNAKSEKLFGFLREEMIGQKVEILIPPRFQGNHVNQRAHFLADAKERPMGTSSGLLGKSKDGKEIPLDISLGRIVTPDGVLIVASLRDVSEHLKTAQYVRSLIEISPDPLVTLDREGKILDTNDAMVKITGVSREQLIGTDITNYFTEPDRVRLGYEQVFSDGLVIDYPLTLRALDGKLIDVLYYGAVYKDSQGNILGMVASARDITDQKKREQNTLELARIIEFTEDAIWSISTDGTFQSWNTAAEKIFGFSAAEIIGQNFVKLIPKEKTADIELVTSTIESGKTLKNYETTRLHKSGRAIPVALTITSIRNSEGIITRWSAIARDITKQKQLIQELADANNLRNEFVAMVAHDIRTPATSISGFAHLLLENWVTIPDETKVEHLKIIVRNTEHLANFINDVMQVARIDSGDFTFNVHEFNLRKTVERAISDVAGHLDAQRIQLDAPDELPPVLGDVERQWQILVNLLSNAMKFSPADKNITVKISVEDSMVAVAVIDQGNGITKEDQSKLFQKFGRISQTLGKKVSGNGLGLYICKILVENQAGKIWCESEPGKGTTFMYTIPISK